MRQSTPRCKTTRYCWTSIHGPSVQPGAAADHSLTDKQPCKVGEAITMTAMQRVTGVLFGAILLLLGTASLVHPQAPLGDVHSSLHVNGHHPLASDANPGTAELPLHTLRRATQVAAANHKRHIGTRVVIYPGIYREAIKLDLR